ncbi:hypothetical protein CQW23_01938 [Capsicum baccatum]|uniref:Uncharacterized protein n=1 Tax=Capsicum baccatum TaxID=33114 RepID=A0A2G2XQ05_CAPBA|nr:hypothetical protein CQW23_01938 [Capsicum baccatum]
MSFQREFGFTGSLVPPGRARLRKEVVPAGQDWPYDSTRKVIRTKQKGHKCDRISAEKRAKTAELMQKMPERL